MEYLASSPTVSESTGMPRPRSSFTRSIFSSTGDNPAASSALSISTACCSLASTGFMDILLSTFCSTINVTFCPTLTKAPSASFAWMDAPLFIVIKALSPFNWLTKPVNVSPVINELRIFISSACAALLLLTTFCDTFSVILGVWFWLPVVMVLLKKSDILLTFLIFVLLLFYKCNQIYYLSTLF